jgi:hypothetical protein
MMRKLLVATYLCAALFVAGSRVAVAEVPPSAAEARAEWGPMGLQPHGLDGSRPARTESPAPQSAAATSGWTQHLPQNTRRQPDSGALVRLSSSPTKGGVLFNGSTLSPWVNQSAAPNRATVVKDPSGGRGTALKLTALNSDIAPLTPTSNPRAQLLSPNVVSANVPFWESYEVYLPSKFPLSRTYANTPATYSNFVQLGSPFYGAPWAGPPSTGLYIINGRFRWESNIYAPSGSRILWQMPAPRRRWLRVTWHIVPAVRGFAELYINDRPVHVRYRGVSQNGVDIPVIDATNYQGPWVSQLSVYYRHNQFPRLTIYFRDFRIAASRRVAENGDRAGVSPERAVSASQCLRVAV